MTEKPTVRIDPGLSDLLPGFLARKCSDLDTVIAKSRDGDFEGIAPIAHRMIGEGSSFGIEKVTEAGRLLERAAKARQAQTVATIARELREYLDSVRIVYSTPD